MRPATTIATAKLAPVTHLYLCGLRSLSTCSAVLIPSVMPAAHSSKGEKAATLSPRCSLSRELHKGESREEREQQQRGEGIRFSFIPIVCAAERREPLPGAQDTLGARAGLSQACVREGGRERGVSWGCCSCMSCHICRPQQNHDRRGRRMSFVQQRVSLKREGGRDQSCAKSFNNPHEGE